MPEQPIKFTCELCGGQHPTSEHQKFITDGLSGGEAFLEKKDDKEALEKKFDECCDLLEKKYGKGFSRVLIKFKLEKVVKLFGGLGQLNGKKILDLGCGSSLPKWAENYKQQLYSKDKDEAYRTAADLIRRGIPEELTWGREYEPWLDRALFELGVSPVGIDIGNLHDELFEHYELDLTKEGALDFLPDQSFDGINMSQLLSSPTIKQNKESFERTKNELERQSKRLLKKEGRFIEWDITPKYRWEK